MIVGGAGQGRGLRARAQGRAVKAVRVARAGWSRPDWRGKAEQIALLMPRRSERVRGRRTRRLRLLWRRGGGAAAVVARSAAAAGGAHALCG